MQIRSSLVIVLTYINTISKWWPPEDIASNLLVPGFTPPNLYNFIALSFWTTKGPVDIALLWSNISYYFGNNSQFGTTNDQIQLNLINRYHNAGMKVLVSAFGSTQIPTTSKQNPVTVANKLSEFVLKNHLDGVDVNWQDSGAMMDGSGANWLIVFTTRLRQLLPKMIITHSPQAPYFSQDYYKKGGYTTVHRRVGHMIDFYNIQFYNQQTTTYSTYNSLCFVSDGWSASTSIGQLIVKWKIPHEKIVVGKPAARDHLYNTGFVEFDELGRWLKDLYIKTGWRTGVMFWKYKSGNKNDDGSAIVQRTIGPLLQQIYKRQKK